MGMENSPSLVDNSQVEEIKRRVEADRQFRGGVGWFFWIAGLSIVNSALYFFGMDLNFVVGLGVTQVIDVVARQVVAELGSDYAFIQAIGFGLDIFIALIFILFGFLGRKQKRWAIILGMVLYALDGIFLFVIQAYMAGIFHIIALFGLGSALIAYNKQVKLVRMNAELREMNSGIRENYYRPPQ